MKRWYYSFFVNHNRMAIYESADYGGVGGYETEAEARKAANSHMDREINENITRLNELTKLASYQSKHLEELIKAKGTIYEIS